MRCQSCGYEDRANAAYCSQCGTTLTQPCGTCGDPVPVGASTCPTCHAPPASTGPLRHEPGYTPHGTAHDSDRTDQTASDSPRTTKPSRETEFMGVVRGFTSRQEPWGEGHRDIWQFRVERFDADGNKLVPIPVEMRGLSYRGSVSNGDEVRVHGRWRDGTLQVENVTNLSTSAQVRAKSYKGLQTLATVFVIIIGLIVVGGIVSLVISGCHDTGGPPPGWPTP